MAAYVVDASVAVKWFVREPESDRAASLLAAPNAFHAPDLLLAELADAFARHVRERIIELSYARSSIEAAGRLFVGFLPARALLDKGMTIANELSHPVYDCIYLAASQQLSAPLITADVKFHDKVAGTSHGARVILLAKWSPSP